MRLARYGKLGEEQPAVVDEDGRLRSLAGHVADICGPTLSRESIDRLKALDVSSLPVVPGQERLGAAVGSVGKFICVGLNYSDHARESGMDVPEQPVLFMKATSAICGPFDDIVLPRGAQKVDWEVELGVVIGAIARDIDEAQASRHVAGYCAVNDLSERKFQLEQGGQWVKGKSCDTFGPIGPWLVTPDDAGDVDNLKMRLSVNGKVYQDGSTANMVFRVPKLISYISRYMTLMPGDIISTGTPAGVGLGQKPPVYLRAGDVVELEIERLGRQCQTVVASS